VSARRPEYHGGLMAGAAPSCGWMMIMRGDVERADAEGRPYGWMVVRRRDVERADAEVRPYGWMMVTRKDVERSDLRVRPPSWAPRRLKGWRSTFLLA